MNNDITILVNSCDAYSDLWEPLFTYLKMFWPNVSDYNIMLNTETKSYRFEDLKITRPSLGPNDLKDWSSRLIACVNQIKTDYVLMIIDDFFPNREVNEEELLKCLDRMKKDSDIRCFYLNVTSCDFALKSPYEGFGLKNNNQYYIFNFQRGLWSVKALKSILRKGEDPWASETMGSLRRSKLGGQYYVALRDKENDNVIYSYDYFGRVHQGKWVKGIKDFAEATGVDIDFSKRDFRPEDVSKERYMYNTQCNMSSTFKLWKDYVRNDYDLNIFGKIDNFFRVIKKTAWFVSHMK